MRILIPVSVAILVVSACSSAHQDLGTNDACGTPSQACCTDSEQRMLNRPACEQGYSCSVTPGALMNVCNPIQNGQQCGGADQACCNVANNQGYCRNGFKCVSGGMCSPCGGFSQVCCASAGTTASCQQGFTCGPAGICS
jgi:hypothetical protein